MTKKTDNSQMELLQGTLDMLILQTLIFGPKHGHSIAHTIEQTSEDVLKIDHGSLYPALQRLERQGWIQAEWGTSANNRRAKYYALTEEGREQLQAKTSKWERMAEAIARILKPSPKES